jgi:altronate hydrolase
MEKIIRISTRDNVAVALKNLEKNEIITLNDIKIKIKNYIERGHKFSIKPIPKQENIIKYGFPIGKAVCDILPGEFVHIHNMKTNLNKINQYTYVPRLEELNCKKENLFFEGFKRSNGQVGIRNELWIIPTVGCINSMADGIIRKFKEEIISMEIDSIEVFKHSFGCGQFGDDLKNTQKILRNIILHPNAGGVLVLGLGCESNQIQEMKEILGEFNKERIKFLNCQEVPDEIKAGFDILKGIYEIAKKDRREKISISELKIGLECGGSDGFSGLSANPLVGAFSDFLICQGGTTVLTEVPEMYGAETLLMERAKNKNVFEKIVNLINNFKRYFINFNVPIYENPSPGNKAGGITTLEEKSLGCTQKSGKAPVVDVIGYDETLRKIGLNLLNSPANDPVATTALGASGCHMVLFTTGRGTPFGSFIPTVKISTNTYIGNLKKNWIDFDAGQLLEGIPIEVVLKNFINFVINVASGMHVRNEINNFKEIAIFKIGVTE